MENRLTQTQLAQVVAEIGELSQRREAELDVEQVKQILQELNLPVDLLDDALMQIHRRQALMVEQRRQRWIAAGASVILVAAIATTTVFIQHRNSTRARVSTDQSRITLAQDDGRNLTTIDRQGSPKVYYRVTLNQAPVGEKLALTCSWIDPSGQIHHNRYSTRQVINNPVWQTYCYHQFEPTAATGNWQVQISLDERVLSTSSFVVK